MKFGVNTQIWVAPFEQYDIGLIDKVAGMGFDVIELGFFSAEPPFKVAEVRQRLKDTGLTAGICSFLSADRDIASTDPEVRKRGIDFMKAMVGTLARLAERFSAARSMPSSSASAISRRLSARRNGSVASTRSARSRSLPRRRA